MPWDGEGKTTKAACKAARALSPIQSEVLAACQAAWRLGLLTQGIGLRPQPWARVSRPVGPVLPIGGGMAEDSSDLPDRTIRRQLAASGQIELDAEFAQMANDATYQEEALQIAEEFAEADWEALQVAERNA
jgi:hypothetical protein